jgi:hypothetical protein
VGRNVYHVWLVRTVLKGAAQVQGRITESHLPKAEESSPGITRFYESLDEKPATFLDLLWAFEGRMRRCNSTRKSRRR